MFRAHAIGNGVGQMLQISGQFIQRQPHTTQRLTKPGLCCQQRGGCAGRITTRVEPAPH